ncbi:MAG: chemotaxis protein CheX [Myxococcales bacterium]|nr:chemotaxis protein CheX [Myxococcales bacterium]MDD9968765.1 chemotaxis protein CheX [Myxococcales bacterium]
MAAPAHDISGEWDEILTRAGAEMCAALGMGTHSVDSRCDQLPPGRMGACVPLVGALQLQLVVLSTNTGVRAMAERLVHHEEGDEPLSRDDIADAISELANQFGGLTKRGLSKVGDLRLGLPVFVRGTLTPPAGANVYAHEVRWGEIPLLLAIIVSG